MNTLLKEATRALISAQSCAIMARWLHEIVGAIITEDSNSRASLLQEVFSSVKSAVTERLNAFRSLPSHDLWYIACGAEANLMYLMYEISGCEKNDDPRIQLATLDCAASKLERANDRPIANTNRVGEILSYCEAEFGCISKSRYLVWVYAQMPAVIRSMPTALNVRALTLIQHIWSTSRQPMKSSRSGWKR